MGMIEKVVAASSYWQWVVLDEHGSFLCKGNLNDGLSFHMRWIDFRSQILFFDTKRDAIEAKRKWRNELRMQHAKPPKLKVVKARLYLTTRERSGV